MSETAAAVDYAFEPLEPSEPSARDSPARVLAQAQAQSEQLREQARAEGYAEGLRAGREQGAAETASAGCALAEALDGVHSLREEVAETLEGDAVELALALAGKILDGARRVPAEEVLETVRGALRRIGERREIAVLVNPADHCAIGAIDPVALREGGVETCELRADERVAPGTAIVRTAEGEVDASVATQLERAREVVQAALAAAQPAT